MAFVASRHVLRVAALGLCALLLAWPAPAQEPPPELTTTVNDFANVIDPDSERRLDTLIRSLQQASGDVVIVATVDTIEPFADIREYAVKMFENRGRGIGERGKDNGLLVLVAMNEREVRIEVGYELERFITDGFAGETVRQYIAPEFRSGDYGQGLVTGVSRLVARIAQGRNVELQGVPRDTGRASDEGSGSGLILALFVLFFVLNAIGRTRRRGRRRWGGTPWSGWNSGVGPFGGSFGGGFGGFGGGGGGFGGFGGGRSGGGGGGGSW